MNIVKGVLHYYLIFKASKNYVVKKKGCTDRYQLYYFMKQNIYCYRTKLRSSLFAYVLEQSFQVLHWEVALEEAPQGVVMATNLPEFKKCLGNALKHRFDT